MALTAVYERFLGSPNPISLSEKASLHYVPTLTSYAQSGPIIRHLESQNKDVVKIKSQKVISAVEGSQSVALEVDTTMEFLSGGGAYLPNIETYVVVDKVVTLPITHIVHFGSDQKISQIRLSWDQACLLKQTEVIGSRGRNWPVFDGKDQIKLITSSVGDTPAPTMSTAPISPRGRSNNESGHAVRNPSPSKKVVKDPYTSLDTFWTQENEQSASPSSKPAHTIAPRAESFKPPPRNMSEIFAAGHEDNEPDSPKKSYAVPVVAPKGGSTNKFGPVRIFEEDEEASVIAPKIYKTNPARYNHFDLGDSDEHDPMQHRDSSKAQPKAVPLTARTNKQASQWDFSDFSTPQKLPVKERPEDKVHFSLDNENKASGDASSQQPAGQKPRRDAEANFEFKDDGTPVERKIVPKARKDAQTHFDFDDQPTPAPARIIARTEAAKGLYRNVLEEDERPLSDISNNAGRRHDFDDSWQASNDYAGHSKSNDENKGAGHTRNKSAHAQNMGANWGSYDQSPEQVKRPTSKASKKGLEPHWGVYGTSEEEPHARPKGRGTQKGFWDF